MSKELTVERTVYLVYAVSHEPTVEPVAVVATKEQAKQMVEDRAAHARLPYYDYEEISFYE